MRRSRLALALAALALVALTIPALSGAAATRLEAKLRGAEEVQGGDKNGKGDALVKVRPRRGKVCFTITFERIEPPNAGHIHKGAAGVDGPVKVTLFSDPDGVAGEVVEDCVTDVRKRLARRIARKPERFYVNVHNAEFPDGAIRGQLQAQ